MRKKAFTMVEILIAISVIGILFAGGSITYNTVYKNNQIDRCEQELADMVSSFENYIIDYGAISISPDVNYIDNAKGIIDLLNEDYLTWEIEFISSDADKHSFKAKTKNKKDPFGNMYYLNIYTYAGVDKDSITGLVVISSAGANATAADVSSGSYDDDVIAIVEPK